MVDQCIIGPISIAEAVLFEDASKVGVEETFKVFCTPLQAKQLEGLSESAVKNEDGPRVVISGQNKGWGMIPIDSSIILVDNVDTTNRAYYHIVSTEESYMGPVESEVKINALKVANLDTLLEMWSTRGYNDGTKLDFDFEDETIQTIFQDEFTTFDLSSWYDKYVENMASGADIISSGGKLVLSGASATNWTWGYIWTVLRQTLPDDFTIEFPLEWVAAPSSGNARHEIECMIIDGRPGDKTELEYKDMIRFNLNVTDVGTQLIIGKRVRGSDSKLLDPITLTSSQKTPMIKMSMEGGSGVSTVTIWADLNWTSGTPSYTKIFGPAQTGIHYDPNLGRYLLFILENASSTSATGKVGSVNIYKNSDALPQRVVLCPSDAIMRNTHDFVRNSESGDLYGFVNPTSNPKFYIDSDNFFDSGVKSYLTYPDSLARIITNTDTVIDPTKFSVTNGLIKLVTTADSVIFNYWNGSDYTVLDEFELGTIHLLKMLYCSPYLVRFQANETKWTLKYGKQNCMVEHPLTDMAHGLKTCHYYEGTTGTLTSGQDIIMDTQFYVNSWNKGSGTCLAPTPTDNYRLQIIKPLKTTIKSDVVPASEITGIGFYNNTELSTSNNHYLALAREFLYDNRQKIRAAIL